MYRLDSKSLRELLRSSKNYKLLNLLKKAKIKISKYNAQVDDFKGKKFRSKHEATIYAQLLQYKKFGIVKFFVRQPILDLTETISWRPDFLVVLKDKSIRFVEAKGKKTKDFLLKLKLFRENYHDIQLDIIYPKQRLPF